MNSALAQVLERPDIWRGDALTVSPAPTIGSGFAALDAELPSGGWPRGQLTELLPESEGIGELSLLLPMLSNLTSAGRIVLLIAPPLTVHAPAWAAAGVRLDCLRLVFPRQSGDAHDARDAQNALWAGVEALRCGGVAATLLWLDPLFQRGIPVNSLRRLHIAAGEGGGVAFLFRPARVVAETSPAPLRLHLMAAGQGLEINLFKRRGAPARQSILIDIARPARISNALAGPAFPAVAPAPGSVRRAAVAV